MNTNFLMDLTEGVALDEPRYLQSDLEPEVTDDCEFDDNFDPYGGLTVLDLADLVDQQQRDSLGWEDVLPPIGDERVKYSPDPEMDWSITIMCSNGLHPNHPDYREWEEEVEGSQLHSDWEPIQAEGWAGRLTLDQQISSKVEDLNWEERRVTFTKRVPLGYVRDPHPCCDGYGEVADWERSAAGWMLEEVEDLLPKPDKFYVQGLPCLKKQQRLFQAWRDQILELGRTREDLRAAWMAYPGLRASLTREGKNTTEQLRLLWKSFWKKCFAANNPRGSLWLNNNQEARLVFLFRQLGIGTERSEKVARETTLRWKKYLDQRGKNLQLHREELLDELEILGDEYTVG